MQTPLPMENHVTSRRHFGAAAALLCVTPGWAWGQSAKTNLWTEARWAPTLQALKALERRAQGRLGVQLVVASGERSLGYRSDERFLMLSSFKTLSAAYVLARHDRGEDHLERRIPVTTADLIPYAPVTEKHVGGPGLTLAELCHATVTTSDNVAVNLMQRSYDGPPALTRFVRSLGDAVTRHDRLEPDLNEPDPTQALDTTTPRAMGTTLARLLFGEVLSETSRRQLQDWLLANTTGARRLRAGFPSGWQVGEKTGTASRVGANDVGFVRPPMGTPVVVVAYLETTAVPMAQRDEAIAEVGQLVARWLQETA